MRPFAAPLALDVYSMRAVSPATDVSFDFQDSLLVPQSPR
jgi:hypothetical protein